MIRTPYLPTFITPGALPLSYTPEQGSPQERQGRQVSPQDLLPRRHASDGHQRSKIRRVRLFDADVADARKRELASDLTEMPLVARGEHDGMRAARQSSGARLSCRVHKLGSLDAALEIEAADHVVEEGLAGGGGGGAVVAMAWSEPAHRNGAGQHPHVLASLRSRRQAREGGMTAAEEGPSRLSGWRAAAVASW